MRIIVSILCCTFTLSWMVTDQSSAFPQESAKKSKQEIEKLIKSLGDDDFVVRENASSKLLEIGEPATPFLKKAGKAPDSEVRFQVKRLIRLIEISGYKKRLEKFLSSTDPNDDFGLAGWKKFSGILGTNRDMRKLFVELHENLPKAMQSLDKSNSDITREFNLVMSSEINTRYNAGGASRSVIRALICNMILSMAHTDNKGNSYSLDSQLANRLQNSSFKEILKTGALGTPFKLTLNKWLNKTSKFDNMTARKFYVAQMLDVKEAGVKLATLCMTPGVSISSSYLGQAILFVGKHGSKKHLPQIYKFIDNTRTGQRAYVLNQNRPMIPRISDHAIEAFSALAKWNPKDFGMYEMQHNPSYQMYTQLPDYGFESTKKRTAGIKLFKEKVKKTMPQLAGVKKSSRPSEKQGKSKKQ